MKRTVCLLVVLGLMLLSAGAFADNGKLLLKSHYNLPLNSEEMVDLVKVIRENTSLPIISQANAGKPSMSVEGDVSYEQNIDDYLRFIPQMIENGANIIGGCCGTNPEYIRRMAEIIHLNYS